jgi:hypothetical protein
MFRKTREGNERQPSTLIGSSQVRNMITTLSLIVATAPDNTQIYEGLTGS